MNKHQLNVEEIMRISREVNRTKTVPELAEELFSNNNTIYRIIRGLRKEGIKIPKAHYRTKMTEAIKILKESNLK